MSRISDLNLATRPFRNRVLPYLAAAALLLAAGVLGIVCLAKLKQNSDTNKVLAARIEASNAEIARLKGEGEKVRQQLTPEQRTVLSAAHRLVANKAFGWSRLFADLEGVLPGSVSASRISVQHIYTDGAKVRAELELGVISRDYAGVQQMIQNMQNSGLFLAELRGQDLQKTDLSVYTEYSLRVVYSPGYSYTAPSPDIAQNSTGGGE
ncbi:MAG: hypothetical protein LC113_05135 [Acidobacteria bacterium]|nr:hypothetical protein [Acidobacteriota bacterium]